MRRFAAVRISLSLALALILWSNAAARGKIAIDGLHGLPTGEDYGIDLPALYHNINFITFDASRLPIYEILAEGIFGDFVLDTVEVDVPAGVHALYVVLEVDYTPGMPIEQLPIPRIVSPDQTTTSGAFGLCHLDYPEPGHYLITADIWYPGALPYRIGTGPCIWEVYPPEDYDAVLFLFGMTWELFHGSPTPYSDDDFVRLQQMLNAGGGTAFVYDGAEPMADKPIIHIQGMASQRAMIQIDIPGRLTYALPEPQSTQPLIWSVTSAKSEEEYYYYEAAFSRPLNFISRGVSANSLVNASWATARDLKLIEFVRGQGYRIGEVGTLAPGDEASVVESAALPYLSACQRLDELLRHEALAAGMTPDEVELFFSKYSWASRVLGDVCMAGNPVALYRLEGEDYDALLPLQTKPEPADKCRVLWVCSILPEEAPSCQSVHLRAVAERPPGANSPVGMLHEYGFLRETYGGDALDDMDAWGWHFYDLALMDTSDNGGSSYEILFHTWGASPLTARLSEGVGAVAGVFTCGVIPQAGNMEVVLSGDDDTWCAYPESPFPPGSYPPVVVAREEPTGGRLVGLSDLHFLADLQDNRQLMLNIFDWFDEGATGEGPDIDLPVAVIETTLVEGISGVSLFTVRNLGDESLVLTTALPNLSWITASGPSEVVISPEGAVTYALYWSAAGLSPGYYNTAWIFNSNDQNEHSLTWPVRLHVERGGGVEPGTNGVPSEFSLHAPFPNPFNARVVISFAVPHDGIVQFDLYNVLGQHVERLPVKTWAAGTHEIQIDFTERPAGLYFLRAESHGAVAIQKLMLLR
ncbi:MAG: T9SS type A sorting domain-containing protein [bacterium]